MSRRNEWYQKQQRRCNWVSADPFHLSHILFSSDELRSLVHSSQIAGSKGVIDLQVDRKSTSIGRNKRRVETKRAWSVIVFIKRSPSNYIPNESWRTRRKQGERAIIQLAQLWRRNFPKLSEFFRRSTICYLGMMTKKWEVFIWTSSIS